MSASEDVYGKVTQVLVESLNVDEGDVTPTATLQGDLGAESIDFLDIVFRLERAFKGRLSGLALPSLVFLDRFFGRAAARNAAACAARAQRASSSGSSYSRSGIRQYDVSLCSPFLVA